MKNFLLALIFCLLSLVRKALNIVTDETDYIAFLNPKYQKEKLEKINEEINFWRKKFEVDQKGFPYLAKVAALLKKKFRIYGEIKNINKSDSIYKLSLKISNGKNKISAYQGLSQN